MTLQPKWLSDQIWVCRSHIPAPQLPAIQPECYYCGAKRPPLKEGMVIRPILIVGEAPPPKVVKAARAQQRQAKQEVARAAAEENNLVGTEPCGWAGCPNKARVGSLYCSRNCSNKNARARHAERKRESGVMLTVNGSAVVPESDTEKVAE